MPLSVTPSSVQLYAVANAQNVSVQESGYAGPFGEHDTCGGVATVAANSTNGPSASYTVTSVAGGTCIVTFSDAFGQTQTLAVTITTSGFNIQ